MSTFLRTFDARLPSYEFLGLQFRMIWESSSQPRHQVPRVPSCERKLDSRRPLQLGLSSFCGLVFHDIATRLAELVVYSRIRLIPSN